MILPIVIAVIVMIVVISIVAVIGVAIKTKADQEQAKREQQMLEDERRAAEEAAAAIRQAENERAGIEEDEPLTDESGKLLAPVDRWMYIIAAQQGHCLEAQAIDGGHIISRECVNNDGQKWLIDPVTNRIKSKTGYCMSTGGDYHSLQECDLSDPNQKFVYNIEDNRIKSLASGECLANRKDDWSWDWGCSKANDHDQYVRFSSTF